MVNLTSVALMNIRVFNEETVEEIKSWENLASYITQQNLCNYVFTFLPYAKFLSLSLHSSLLPSLATLHQPSFHNLNISWSLQGASPPLIPHRHFWGSTFLQRERPWVVIANNMEWRAVTQNTIFSCEIIEHEYRRLGETKKI